VPDRDALLHAIAVNHRAWMRRAPGARTERLGGIELIVNGREGAIPFPARRTRAAVATVLDRVDALRLRTASCWSLDEDKALGAFLIAPGF
jgi:hypothetical protein